MSRADSTRPETRRRSRRRAWQWGRWAETLCVLHLSLRGYRILARRLRCPVGEIDILAGRAGVLAVIEVKARPDTAQAAEALTPRQRARLVDAARWIVAHRPDLAGLAIGFDVMLFVPWRLPRHLIDAWRTDGA